MSSENINLNIFCDQFGEMMIDLKTPFSQGEYTYATNGFVVVRVPRVDKYQREIDLQVELLPWSPSHPGQWIRPAAFYRPPTIGWCPTCSNTGYARECGDCAGLGFSDQDCPSCKGWGVVPDMAGKLCPRCFGSFRAYFADPPVVYFFGTKMDVSLLDRVSVLPDIKIFLPASPEGKVFFIFDGGDGILMAMRV